MVSPKNPNNNNNDNKKHPYFFGILIAINKNKKYNDLIFTLLLNDLFLCFVLVTKRFFLAGFPILNLIQKMIIIIVVVGQNYYFFIFIKFKKKYLLFEQDYYDYDYYCTVFLTNSFSLCEHWPNIHTQRENDLFSFII